MTEEELLLEIGKTRSQKRKSDLWKCIKKLRRKKWQMSKT